MNSKDCPICLETFNRQLAFPQVCHPCGHVCCKNCIHNWFRTGNRTCPVCRQHISTYSPNITFMNLIEESYHLTIKENMVFRDILENNKINKEFKKEVLRDNSEYTFICLDNSLSMESYDDGKIFRLDSLKGIICLKNINRWQELKEKSIQIAEYNLKRKLTTCYYLLNPLNGNWVSEIDFIIIDPNKKDCHKKLDILKNTILSCNNIRGNTPLDKITQEFHQFIKKNNLENKKICYNIITDGEPNNREGFERELRRCAKDYSVFLVINLCTDNENIISYYDDLDVKLGNEMSGIDVIDDLEGEAKQVRGCGNLFFVYSFNIHLSRMAGCHSVIADQMDEIEFPISYTNKFLKDFFKIEELSIDITDKKNITSYLQKVRLLNQNEDSVYNFLTKSFEKPINISKLSKKLYHQYYLFLYQKYILVHLKKIFCCFLFIYFLYIFI